MRVSNRFSAAFEATLDWIELTLASRAARRKAGARLGRAAKASRATTGLA
jgi:hypothetical protein